MTQLAPPIAVDYFTDVLCVWAWIAQPRLDELHAQYGEGISIEYRYVDIFGDSFGKIKKQWGEAGGFEKFAAHVHEAGSGFEHCNIHSNIWTHTRPRSSQQAHLLLKAVQLNAGSAAVADMALRIRRAFFQEARDISDMGLLLDLAVDAKLDRAALQAALNNGSAMAALSSDLRSASEQSVKGSPTWVLNHGRQLLYGNVGYRILSANIEELLKHPGSEASWC